MAKRILITGANGFVASNVIWQADPDCELHALSRESGPSPRRNLHWHVVNSAEAEQLRQTFQSVRPDAVIHTAALASIDYCETHQQIAREVNVGITQTLADLCASSGAKLVFCSSDTVFDGEHAPYRETDMPRPVNFYATTKVEAEKIVSLLGASGIIARLSLVVGLPMLSQGNSFLATMIPTLKAGREVTFPTNEIRTPVDVITVARALIELAVGSHSGIFHLAGNDSLSRFAMAQRIAVRLGFPKQQIIATDSSDMPGRAPRPRNVSLDNTKARAELKTPMLSLDEGLALALQSRRITSP
ncbi:MAG: SDR family oxidoreductase [Verrucomicrobia bacterium]|nr:SDR family oxidoreductase [Verrucomicrobiota bacterium]